MIYFLSLFLVYLFIFLFYSLKLRSNHNSSKYPPAEKITLLIPLRNEAENLNLLFDSLSAQNYPPELWTVLFWNDASSDESSDMIENFIRSKPGIEVSIINEPKQIGKKEIINKAVNLIESEWILLCDADTHFGPNRLRSFSDHIHENLDLIIGEVQLEGSSFFQKLQSLEYKTMMAIAKASANLNDPILGSSANLFFRRKAFLKVMPYRKNISKASGDDVFLINGIKKLRKKNCIFLDQPEVVVHSKAEVSFKKAFIQRLRWAGKNPMVADLRYQYTANATLICNVLLIVLFTYGLFNNEVLNYFFIAFGIKFFADLILYTRLAPKKTFSILHFLTLNLVYPFYVTLVGLLSFVIRPRWK